MVRKGGLNTRLQERKERRKIKKDKERKDKTIQEQKHLITAHHHHLGEKERKKRTGKIKKKIIMIKKLERCMTLFLSNGGTSKET